MKSYFICYNDDRYEFQKHALIKEMLAEPFDYYMDYTLKYLKACRFYDNHKPFFDALPNAGCIWKPHLILEFMLDSSMQYGDLLVYSDCGDSIHKGYLDFIRNSIKNDVFLVQGNFINGQWTKRDCFRLMDCTDLVYYESPQLEAGQIGLIKTDATLALVKEWLHYCSDPRVLLDGEPEQGLIRHSRDQSVLTNLQIKYHLPTTHINMWAGKYVTYNHRG